MEKFNIIIFDGSKNVVHPIPTEGLRFLPKVAGFFDIDFVLGQFDGQWCVWHGETGLRLSRGETECAAADSAHSLLYEKGHIHFMKAVALQRTEYEKLGFEFPINDPSVMNLLNERFQYESDNKQTA